jgi:CheY-like chemotaxis protein
MDRLFKPFSQVDASYTREFGGTGLGLSITRKVAELMNGEVGVQSEEGRGSKFWFRIQLPLANPNEDRRTRDRTALPTDTRPAEETSGHILYVEDNHINQTVIATFLNRIGYDCKLADNGQLALDALKKDTLPTLILMDCDMPVMDGFEATRRIRAMELEMGLPRIPIVALTASAFEEDRQKCLACGMDDFLTKPVSVNTLRETLGNWITNSPSSDSSKNDRFPVQGPQ